MLKDFLRLLLDRAMLVHSDDFNRDYMAVSTNEIKRIYKNLSEKSCKWRKIKVADGSATAFIVGCNSRLEGECYREHKFCKYCGKQIRVVNNW